MKGWLGRENGKKGLKGLDMGQVGETMSKYIIKRQGADGGFHDLLRKR
jgi:hypothetical protein